MLTQARAVEHVRSFFIFSCDGWWKPIVAGLDPGRGPIYIMSQQDLGKQGTTGGQTDQRK